MIPWTDFDISARNDVATDHRVQLDEYWIAWVGEGATMTHRFMDSPMMENAHERQFVVSQQCGDSAGFDMEHMRRIGECLIQLERYFDAFATDELCRPTSPDATDLACCWKPDIALDSMAPLSLPSTTPEDVRPASPLASQTSLPDFSGTPSRVSKITLLGPQPIDVGDEENSEEAEEQFKRTLLVLPRARTTLSSTGTRSQRLIRQRRKNDSKFSDEGVVNTKKRSLDWVADQHEDELTAAMRSRSITSLRAEYGTYAAGIVADHLARREET